MVMEDQEIGLASECIPVPRVHDSLVVQVKQQQQILNNTVKKTNNTIKMSEEEKKQGINKTGQRKPRTRKKALHAAILKQMEFYFSDANLSKDRFLSNLIQNDPYVDLLTFINFNKIRSLTTETNRIAKALESSKILSLSDDSTKVCRKTPINLRSNTDDCTVYVQGLPPDADHDWLISIFSQYGSVAYVSIPRYKRNKKLKGFAFVEFDNVEETEKCLKAFQDKHCILPSHTTPDEILSITTYTQEDDFKDSSSLLISKVSNSTLNDGDFQSFKLNQNIVDDSNEQSLSLSTKTTTIENNSDNNDDDDDDDDCDYSDEINPKKIKIDESINDITEINKNQNEKININNDSSIVDDVKDIKFSDSRIVNKESKEIDEKKKKKRKRKNRGNKNEHYQQEQEQEQQQQQQQQQQQKQKQKQQQQQEQEKEQEQQQQQQQQQQQLDIIDFGLRIMAKKEWKKLRNKYLQSQRDKMKQLKQHLLKKRNQWNDKQSPVNNQMDTTTTTTVICQEQDSKNKNSSPKFNFAEGLIIKMELDKPCSNPKNLKNEIKSTVNSDLTTPTDIQYIDVREGDNYVYIRCDTTKNAEKLLKKLCVDKTSIILTGVEEKDYWDKMFKDREQKFVISKKNRIKQRGRDKLLKKAEKELGKHIRFDD